MTGEVRVEGLGKSYRQWGSEWRRMASWFVKSVAPQQERWVVRNVSFSIAPGEALGIVGPNGAGKSTLLKMITGTTRPTEGRVVATGRVSAILELGMGFNPDLTGRQNAGHSAGLMGYSRADIERTMPEIESFAEIGDYFDQPMRVYSSGMHVRVAFAVATAFQPDLLIVDEALSVGDSYFQHKSFDRIHQFKASGVSIIIVTHSMGDVRSLCDRVILLDEGRVVKEGMPDEVVDYYNAIVAEKENQKLNIEQRRAKNGWLVTTSGTGEVQIDSLVLLDATTGQQLAVAHTGQELEIVLRVSARSTVPRLVLGYMLRDRLGHLIWGTNTWHTHQVQEDVKRGESVEFRMKFRCTLGPGSYSVSPALVSSDTHLDDNFQWVDNLLVFDVVNFELQFFLGSSWLDAKFSISRCDSEHSA